MTDQHARTDSAQAISVHLLGDPQFVADGTPIVFPVRKAAALATFLAANGAQPVERPRLSALLWDTGDEQAARASLRQTLSMLRMRPETRSLIASDRSSAWFAGDPRRTDLARFTELIGIGSEQSYREALALWRGEPLAGAEVGAEAFDEWVAAFRSETVGYIYRFLSTRFEALCATGAAESRQSQLLTALCELIVRIEPADVAASEWLIRALCERNNVAAAMRRLRTLRSALAELDVAIPARVNELADDLGLTDTMPGPGPALAPGQQQGDGVPRVMLVRPSGMPPMPELFAYAHSEVMCQLTRFRCLRAFEPMPFDIKRAEDDPGGVIQSAIRLEEDLGHDYRLLLWNEPNVRSIYLRCVNARQQHTVSCLRIPYNDLQDREDAERAIAGAINAIEADIMNEAPVQPDTPFSRWVSAFKLLQDFTVESDRAAMMILDDLASDPHGSKLSLVHSLMSCLYMKQRMYQPGTSSADADTDERILRGVKRALALDTLEPFNHVMAGWHSIQTGSHERALDSFQRALALNPFSARTLISAAEAHAFCDDLRSARTLADRALKLTGPYPPPLFQSYLASIAYLEGNLSECIDRLRRAPQNVHTALLQIAAHQERGEDGAVTSTRVELERLFRRMEPTANLDRDTLSSWIVTSSMTKDRAAKHRFMGSLESAGLPIGKAS